METNAKEHLETRIRMIEDRLLRTKNLQEAENLSNALFYMRKELQKIQWKEGA